MARGTTQAERSVQLMPGSPEYAAEVERQLAQLNLGASPQQQQQFTSSSYIPPSTAGLPNMNGPSAAPIEGACDDYTPPSPMSSEEIFEAAERTAAAQQAASNVAGAGNSNRPGYQRLGGGAFGLPFMPSGEDLLRLGLDYATGKASETSAKDAGKDYGRAYAESYPRIMEAHRGEVEAMMQKDLDMQRQFTPQQQRLDYDTLVGDKKAGIPGVLDYGRVGSRLTDQTRSLDAGTDLDIMRQQGPYMAEATMDQLAITDQPFMRTREAGARGISDLLGSINMGGLSGGERAEIERMNARRNLQRGSAGGGGNLTAIENAMQFGSALDRKRAALGNALQTATSFMAGSRSGFDPIQATLGRGSGTNQIAAGFQGVQPVSNYSNQMPGTPNLANVNTGGNIFDTVTRGAKSRTDWLNPGN